MKQKSTLSYDLPSQLFMSTGFKSGRVIMGRYRIGSLRKVSLLHFSTPLPILFLVSSHLGVVLNKIPEPGLHIYDYVVCTTKNIPDHPPPLSSQIAAAITPGHTVIVLIQNGLNIEKPIIKAFPQNAVLSGVSMIGSHEVSPGTIEHDDSDILHIGAFRNSTIPEEKEIAAAQEFVRIYAASGKTDCTFVEDVQLSRWRKLVYNTCLNSICAITGLDTGRIRLAEDIVASIVRPAMEEVRACARAKGVFLDDDVADYMINVDPIGMYLQPSMLVDVKKV